MAHPFEVGKMYRNRVGEYTVTAIDGDRMTIRYVNGNTISTSATTQARIWENIQFEEQAAREEERQRLAQEARLQARKRASRPAQPAAPAAEAAAAPAAAPRTRGRFAGFQEGDFMPKARGIAWAGRVALGGMLANELTRRMGRPFNKWLVPLQPEVHVGLADRYDPEAGGRNAALFVAVSEKGVSYGFRVGKPELRVEPAWPWPVLLAALSVDKDLRAALENSMRSRGLSIDIYAMEVSYGPVAHVTLDGDHFKWEQETAAEAMSRELNWDELIDYVQHVAPDARADFYLRSSVAKEDAVAAGPGIARDILSTFGSLMPLYEASVAGPTG